jgi:hypothetical protein
LHTLDTDVTDPAELDRFVRLAIIGEQSHDPARSLSARIATAYVLNGEDDARQAAGYEGGDDVTATTARVIAYMRAIRTERIRYWSVSYDQNGRTFTGTRIESPYTVRAQHEWAARQPGVTAVRITEYTDTLTSVPVDADALPRDEDHQAPHVPGAHEVHRFYRFDNAGPAALRDAAAVALTSSYLRASRPRRYHLPALLLDTIRVVVARPVDHDQVTPL